MDNMSPDDTTVLVTESGQEREQRRDGSTEPSVTIGIPVFNGEKTIGQSIDSILNQTHRNLCVRISDNASTDGTGDECRERAGEDARINYYRRERNIGVFRNYNAAFLECRTKYFKWQSSSDWCQPDFIKVCVDVLEADAAVVLACPEVLLVRASSNAEPYSDDFGLGMDDPADRFRYLLKNIKLSNLFNGLVRTDALQRSVLNRPFLGSDVVLLADLALKGKFVLVPQRLWYRRMTPATSSVMKSGADRADFFSGLPADYEFRVAWKTITSLVEVVIRSDVGASAKVNCLAYLLKMARWNRRQLWRELVHRR